MSGGNFVPKRMPGDERFSDEDLAAMHQDKLKNIYGADPKSRVSPDKRRRSLLRGLQWLSGSCEVLTQALQVPVDPDCDLDDLAELLSKVNPLVSQYMEDSFGDGDDE